MRELISKYGYYIAGAVIVIAALLVAFRGGKPNVIDVKSVKGFYVDDETGEEFVRPVDPLPPLMGNTGRHTLVEAIKFTTDDGATVVTAYLQKYSDEAIEELKSLSEDDIHRADILENGRLIRLPGDGQKWVPLNSHEGQQILHTPIPGEGPLKRVLPPTK